MVKIGDKIKLIKSCGMCTKNMIFEIRDIMDYGISVKNEFGFGFIKCTVEEFNEHFIKVRQWTPWTKSGLISYKTDNEKYVIVRYNGYEAKASCNLNYDTFNFETGMSIALSKLGQKMMRNL